MAGAIKVVLTKSMIGRPEKHRRVLRAMGLTKRHKTVLVKDNPMMRGMIKKISHLVQIEENVDEA